MSSIKSKIGLIGSGRMGSFHLEKLLKDPDVELTGFFDADRALAEKKGIELGVKTFFNLEELLFESDALIISSPTQTHFSLGKLAIESGLHVFLEKPLCETAAQASQLIALAKEKNKILQTGFVERYRWLELQKKIPQEFLDKPILIGTERSALSPSREKGLDVVTDLMIHDIDFVLSVLREPPVSIIADGVSQGIRDIDVAHVRLEFSSGSVAHLKAQWGSSIGRRETHLVWPDKYLIHDLMNGKVILGTGQESAHRKASETNLGEFDALASQLSEFVKAIKGQKPPYVSGQDGLRALEICEEIKNRIKDRASDRVWISQRERKFLSKYWEDYAH